MNTTIEQLLQERILILDGATGTMLQSFHLTENDFRGKRFADITWQMQGNNDILNLTRPDIVETVHRRYLEAGADIITTNTFSAQRVSMADYHVEDLVRQINLAGCQIARRIADEFTQRTPQKPRFVAASVGPTNKTCSISPDVNNPARRDITFDQLAAAYREQIEAVMDGGADIVLGETAFDTLNVKALLAACEEAFIAKGRRLPIMLSATVSDKAGRTLSGQTLRAFVASIEHAPLLSVGLNCSFGPLEIKPYLEELAHHAPFYISVHPNAGLPNELGRYDITPQQMAQQMEAFISDGLVNIIGGCCGTTDAFIAQYPALVQNPDGSWRQPHIPAARTPHLRLAGLELLEVTQESNFINVGERCNVAGSKKFLRLISEQNYDEAQHIARKQVDDGAQVLDINMDDGLLDAQTEMVNFLNLITSDPDIARVPLMIDSSNWDVIMAALKCVQGKCIVNSISLKEGEATFLSRARDLKRFGAAVVVMAFDEEGQATSYDKKVAVCQRAYRLLTEQAGFNPNDIIFDPNILTIGTGIAEHNDYAKNFIEAAAWIRKNLPGAHVSGGVSNLSFAFRGNNYLRHAMHAVFLYHAIQAGMDMGIVNPSAGIMYEDILPEHRTLIEDLIFNRRPDATERVLAVTQDTTPEAASATDQWHTMTLDERLQTALRKGIAEHLEEDLQEALTVYGRAVKVIEGPLMAGMSEVGRLFGAGKMFLPQVVKTARTMKRAVEYLQPYILQEKQGGTSSAGRVVLATVKGDVHDIGKNIVSVVMACNNYDIIDLGVMTPAETIVEAVQREKADILGLSGLITPSLDEMVHTARLLREAGIRIPILIGGATTSALHTALKIAPVYDGPVVWVKDAAQNSLVAASLLNEQTHTDYLQQLQSEQATLRQQHTQAAAPLLSIEEARRQKPNFFD